MMGKCEDQDGFFLSWTGLPLKSHPPRLEAKVCLGRFPAFPDFIAIVQTPQKEDGVIKNARID